VSVGTTRWSGFLQDEWKPLSNLSINVGVRYDLDTNANDPDFSHPLVPNGRDRDTNNIQPRLGFSWDVTKSGQYVVRGGAGIFTGRYLLVPIFTELQQNGATGWLIRQRLNGLLLGLPALALDPANPRTTGIALPPDITLLDKTFDAPEATQASLGATARLGNTGLYFDVEGVYVKGRKEIMQRDANWSGNATHVRPNPAYNQINTYTNDGESVYKGLTFSVNGNLKGGHLITTSVTLASKKNRNDDFSPEFPVGYPSDSADPAAEYGRARSDERFRLVMTGIFRLPWQVTVSPIFEYGSGQPWTHRYGYDFNGDGKTGDRQPGVERFGEDGPPFRQLSLRVTKGVPLPFGKVDVFVEAYNVFNTVNYDVSTIDGGEFTAGPTLANPNAVAVRNSNFGKFVNTFPGREVQFGVRLSF
ncbi:MAG TPA: TonB-dependent receptor, partial [Thermoanaerobaculia bacterium]|nr:TonB-dependent receptor [Thermoanaerobaculia bacterium]